MTPGIAHRTTEPDSSAKATVTSERGNQRPVGSSEATGAPQATRCGGRTTDPPDALQRRSSTGQGRDMNLHISAPQTPVRALPLPLRLQDRIFDRRALHRSLTPVDRLRSADILQVTHGAHRSVTMSLTWWKALGYHKDPVSRPPEEVAVVVKRARGVASHQTALRLHGFLLPPWLQEDEAQVHVSRPHARGVAHRRGVVTHGRSVPAEDVAMLMGSR